VSANTTTGEHPIMTPAGGTALRTKKRGLEAHPTWKNAIAGLSALLAAAGAIIVWVLNEARSSAVDTVAPVRATVHQLDRRLAQEHADHMASEFQLRQELRDVNNDVRGIAGKPALPPVQPPPAAPMLPEVDP